MDVVSGKSGLAAFRGSPGVRWGVRYLLGGSEPAVWSLEER